MELLSACGTRERRRLSTLINPNINVNYYTYSSWQRPCIKFFYYFKLHILFGIISLIRIGNLYNFLICIISKSIDKTMQLLY